MAASMSFEPDSSVESHARTDELSLLRVLINERIQRKAQRIATEILLGDPSVASKFLDFGSDRLSAEQDTDWRAGLLADLMLSLHWLDPFDIKMRTRRDQRMVFDIDLSNAMLAKCALEFLIQAEDIR